ncbi:MAG: hypothetical protein Q8P84_06975, partial [Deltaproteobacteria bacterium]|nr:hypothetical protein [Deltaproteobacteria bacterium]
AQICHDTFSKTMWDKDELGELATKQMGIPTFVDYINSSGLAEKTLATYYTDAVAIFKTSLAPASVAVTKAGDVRPELKKMFAGNTTVLNQIKALEDACINLPPEGPVGACAGKLDNDLFGAYQAAQGNNVSLAFSISLLAAQAPAAGAVGTLRPPPNGAAKSGSFVQVDPIGYEKVGTGGAYIPEDGAYRDRCVDGAPDSNSNTCQGSGSNYLTSTKRYIHEGEEHDENVKTASPFNFYKILGVRVGHSWFSKDESVFGGISGALRLYYGQASDTDALGFSQRFMFSGDVSGHVGFRKENFEGKATLGPTGSIASGDYPLGEDLPFGNPFTFGIRGCVAPGYYLNDAKTFLVGAEICREQQIDTFNRTKLGGFGYHGVGPDDRFSGSVLAGWNF